MTLNMTLRDAHEHSFIHQNIYWASNRHNALTFLSIGGWCHLNKHTELSDMRADEIWIFNSDTDLIFTVLMILPGLSHLCDPKYSHFKPVWVKFYVISKEGVLFTGSSIFSLTFNPLFKKWSLKAFHGFILYLG